jgi:hypothetical protein
MVFVACRKGTESGFVPIVPSLDGNQGCAATLATLTAPTAVFSSTVIGPNSQIVAASGSEFLFLTGADGSIRRLDFSAGGAPVVTLLVAGSAVDDLLALAGVQAPAVPSGIAVLDADNLVVVEQTSNTLLLVKRGLLDAVSFLAGIPMETGGFADGAPGATRFSFSDPTQVLATGDGLLYVADPGNHSIRRVSAGAQPETITIAGTGAPFYVDGPLTSTFFDTPTGLSVSCAGELLVTETGSVGSGGHRLRGLEIGLAFGFGGFNGSSRTLAGNGSNGTTQGIDDDARLAAPVAPISTSDGKVYWVDSGTGILRRYDFATGLSDCPLFPDCSSAVAAGGSFTEGGGFSLASTDSGTLFVLDCDAGTLFRVTP